MNTIRCDMVTRGFQTVIIDIDSIHIPPLVPAARRWALFAEARKRPTVIIW
jgi:hypothetical protein